jgi:hypothetical protein
MARVDLLLEVLRPVLRGPDLSISYLYLCPPYEESLMQIRKAFRANFRKVLTDTKKYFPVHCPPVLIKNNNE